MKKNTMKMAMFSIVVSTMIYTGCSTQSNTESSVNSEVESKTETAEETKTETGNEQAVGTIEEFYPFDANTFYNYEGDGVIATQEIFYTHVENGITQRRLVAGNGDEITEVLQLSNGELKVIFADTEGYHYENILGYSDEEFRAILNYEFPVMTVLKEPLVLGNTWSFDGVAECEITATDIEIETPYGTFETIEVTTTGIVGPSQQYTQYDYYAEGIGLVKTVSKGEDAYEMGFSLVEVETDIAMNKELHMFYNNPETNILDYVENVIMDFETNEDIADVLTDVFRQNLEGYEPIFTEDMSINSIYVARPSLVDAENFVIVDLSSAFSKETIDGLDEDMEIRLLQGIALTCGHLFKSKRVELTVNGEVYSSENITLSADDYFAL